MFDGLLHVIYSDDGSPMIATAPEPYANNLDVVEDEPTPERVAEVLKGDVPVYPLEKERFCNDL